MYIVGTPAKSKPNMLNKNGNVRASWTTQQQWIIIILISIKTHADDLHNNK